MQIFHVLFISFTMFWEVLWPLILGFFLSAVVQAVVSHKKMTEYLGDNSPKNITYATLFGIASSSCSYAAVALARSLFQKGASFASSMIFEISSTNLVLELGIVLTVIMGWQFMAAEYIGGIFMIIIIAFIFRLTLTPKLVRLAHQQAAKGLIGKMEGHAAMDMSVEGKGVFPKIFSRRGVTAISHFFVMDWTSVWVDLLIGFFVAGALAEWVPATFWQSFFFENNATLNFIVGPLIGPLVAIISFVCSVGNIPLAAILWHGGISFGGVVSFIFADLIVLPVLDIYRKYYGWKVMAYILTTFYVTMTAAGYIVEIIFSYLRLVPTNRQVFIVQGVIQWNYTSILNTLFLCLALVLIVRFLQTGGREMLTIMHATNRDTHHDHI